MKHILARLRPIGRWVFFRVVLLALVWGTIEGLSFFAFWLHYQRPFSFEDLAARKQRMALMEVALPSAEADRGSRWHDRILHPYLGYASNPLHVVPRTPHCSEGIFGFFGNPEYNLHDTNAVYIYISGGSLAMNLYCEAYQELYDALSALPRFKGRRLVLNAFALSGKKQPQQLLALRTHLLQGGRIDLLINLDGFNELFGAMLLHRTGIQPSFPWQWDLLTTTISSNRAPEDLYAYLRVRRFRQSAARVHEALGFSVLAGFVWSVLDDIAQDRMRQRFARLASAGPAAGKARGRLWGAPLSTPDILAYGAEIWARSLYQMSSLAEQYKFHLLSFIQPNPYVPGAKVFTAEEQRLGLPRRAEYRGLIEQGYPHLRRLGAGLQGHRLRVHDLSFLYKGVDRTVFSDDCCHLNAEGNRLLVQAVVRAIAELPMEVRP